MARNGTVVRRFDMAERVTHWLVAVTFILLLLSGFGLSYPRFSWLTAVLGGGTAARVLHPWVGMAFTAGVIAMAALWAREMVLDRDDRTWLRAIRGYVTRDRARVPAAGKYNGGQKVYFWLQIVLGILFLVSGIPLWLPDAFSAGVFNVSRLVHYLAALAGTMSLIPHVYLGTVAYPGTLRSMLEGTVTRSWARHHHPRWQPEEPQAPGNP